MLDPLRILFSVHLLTINYQELLILTDLLLPQEIGLQLERVANLTGLFFVTVRTTKSTAQCPLCHFVSERVHSRYFRQVSDLSWAGSQVELRLQVRRFFCLNSECKRTTFAERLTHIAAYARRTDRLAAVLNSLGMELGGEAAARQATILAMPTSADTILRLVSTTPLPAYAEPSAVGIDEWSYRRGRNFGTIIVDLERHCPIELLADRTTESAAAWFKAHPNIKFISRDRSSIYAEAARRGAPQAIQVADRWHLLKNLTAALERFFLAKTDLLKLALGQKSGKVGGTEDTTTTGQAVQKTSQISYRKSAATELYPDLPPQLARERQQRLASKVSNYRKVHSLRSKELSIAAISRQVGITTKTVRRYLTMPEPPTPKRPNRNYSDILAEHKAYLIKRWQEGCHNGRQLARELAELTSGKAPSVPTVARFTKLLRQGEIAPTSYAPLLLENLSPKTRPLTAYQAALVMTLDLSQRKGWQQEYMERLCQLDAEIASVNPQVLAFSAMVRQRKGYSLKEWLEQAIVSKVAQLKNFAKSLQADFDAVQAGLTYSISNGQTEGQNNRLKYLKRQMYGRAGFKLLRARVLHRKAKSPLLALIEKLAG